jgi:hypothetical protein
LNTALSVLVAVTPLAAQNPTNATRAFSETSTRLKTFTLSDIRTISQNAEAGDAEAQYWIGQIYENGRLVKKDDELARKWTLRSTERNFGAAEHAMIRWEDDPMKREKWLRRAAEDGEADAQMWLGVAYEQDWFGTIDLVEAAKWYQWSADQGNPDAQVALGEMYESGDGVEQDYSQAVAWYRRAAEHVPDLGGAGQGRGHLGQLYLEGKGVEKDHVQAYMWFMVQEGEPKSSAIEAQMSPEQIRRAQQLADEWKKQHQEPVTEPSIDPDRKSGY